ncbi:MAG: hypothetical protein WC783_02645 [Candidatus Paceibacterota bacterium]|jgi:hypothetical protein
MRITSIKVADAEKLRRTGEAPKSSTVYFFPKGENLVENLRNREYRPNKIYSKFLPFVFKQIGLPYPKKISWSQVAGCSCGCSPGFKIHDPDLNGLDIFIDIDMRGDEIDTSGRVRVENVSSCPNTSRKGSKIAAGEEDLMGDEELSSEDLNDIGGNTNSSAHWSVDQVGNAVSAKIKYEINLGTYDIDSFSAMITSKKDAADQVINGVLSKIEYNYDMKFSTQVVDSTLVLDNGGSYLLIEFMADPSLTKEQKGMLAPILEALTKELDTANSKFFI